MNFFRGLFKGSKEPERDDGKSQQSTQGAPEPPHGAFAPDYIRETAKFLPLIDIARLMRTSKTFAEALNIAAFWEYLIARDFGADIKSLMLRSNLNVPAKELYKILYIQQLSQKTDLDEGMRILNTASVKELFKGNILSASAIWNKNDPVKMLPKTADTPEVWRFLLQKDFPMLDHATVKDYKQEYIKLFQERNAIQQELNKNGSELFYTNPKALESLIERAAEIGVDVDVLQKSRHTDDYFSLLYMATRSNEKTLVEKLLDAGANIYRVFEIKSHDKKTTTLELAIVEKKHEIIRIFMKKNALKKVNVGELPEHLSTLIAAIGLQGELKLAQEIHDEYKEQLDNGYLTASIRSALKFIKHNLSIANEDVIENTFNFLFENGAVVTTEDIDYATNNSFRKIEGILLRQYSLQNIDNNAREFLQKQFPKVDISNVTDFKEKYKELHQLQINLQKDIDKNGIGLITSNPEKLQSLIEQAVELEVDVNKIYANNETLLSAAVQKGNVSLVKVLLDAGADIYFKSGPKRIAIVRQLIESGNLELITLAIDKIRPSELRDLLISLAKAENVELIKKILSQYKEKIGIENISAALIKIAIDFIENPLKNEQTTKEILETFIDDDILIPKNAIKLVSGNKTIHGILVNARNDEAWMKILQHKYANSHNPKTKDPEKDFLKLDARYRETQEKLQEVIKSRFKDLKSEKIIDEASKLGIKLDARNGGIALDVAINANLANIVTKLAAIADVSQRHIDTAKEYNFIDLAMVLEKIYRQQNYELSGHRIAESTKTSSVVYELALQQSINYIDDENITDEYITKIAEVAKKLDHEQLRDLIRKVQQTGNPSYIANPKEEKTKDEEIKEEKTSKLFSALSKVMTDKLIETHKQAIHGTIDKKTQPTTGKSTPQKEHGLKINN